MEISAATASLLNDGEETIGRKLFVGPWFAASLLVAIIALWLLPFVSPPDWLVWAFLAWIPLWTFINWRIRPSETETLLWRIWLVARETIGIIATALWRWLTERLAAIARPKPQVAQFAGLSGGPSHRSSFGIVAAAFFAGVLASAVIFGNLGHQREAKLRAEYDQSLLDVAQEQSQHVRAGAGEERITEELIVNVRNVEEEAHDAIRSVRATPPPSDEVLPPPTDDDFARLHDVWLSSIDRMRAFSAGPSAPAYYRDDGADVLAVRPHADA